MDDQAVERLRDRAVQALEKIRENPPGRPYFVEFAGTPKAGKSTNIAIIDHFFRRVGFNVLSPSEGASKRTPRFLRGDWPAFNAWTASYALTQVLEGLYDPGKPQISILDRGLFDALAWFEMLERDGAIDGEFKETVQNFLTIEKWRGSIDRVFLFTTTPEISMERENNQMLVHDEGSAMNPARLSALNDAYDVIRDQFAGQFRLTPVDTSKTDQPRDTAFDVVEVIVDDLAAVQDSGAV